MHLPAVNNRAQALQQMMAFRAMIESRQQQSEEEEKPANRRGGSPVKNGMTDGTSRSTWSASASQHDAAGPSSNPGCRSVCLPPRYSPSAQQTSMSEDVSGIARPSDRAVHTVDVNLSLSIPSSRQQLPVQSTGQSQFPSTLRRVPRAPEHTQRVTSTHESVQGSSAQGSGVQFGVAARPGALPHLPGRPPSAQLTIFYSGMVNVYDNVPADKAQAIMLLAGSGSSWSSTFMNPPAAAPTRSPSALGGSRPMSSTAGLAPTSNDPAQPSVTVAQVPPPVSSVPTASITGGLLGRPTIPIHAELPQARKASLFRFLEKRKDRVRGAAPYGTPMFGSRKPGGDRPCTPPREKSPSSNMGTMAVRSPSPGSTGLRKRSPSPGSRAGPSQPSEDAGEMNSPMMCPASPQPACQPGSSGNYTLGLSVSQRSSKGEHADWANKQPHPVTGEEKPEPTVDGGPPTSQLQ